MTDKKESTTEAPERCKACKGDGTLTGCRGSGDCKRCKGSGVEPAAKGRRNIDAEEVHGISAGPVPRSSATSSDERRRLLKIIGDVGADRGRREGLKLAASFVMEHATTLFTRGEDDLARAFRRLSETIQARPVKDHPHDEVERAFRVLVVREDLDDSEGGAE